MSASCGSTARHWAPLLWSESETFQAPLLSSSRAIASPVEAYIRVTASLYGSNLSLRSHRLSAKLGDEHEGSRGHRINRGGLPGLVADRRGRDGLRVPRRRRTRRASCPQAAVAGAGPRRS